jgi:L-methionine (R)-S-oxide reductase
MVARTSEAGVRAASRLQTSLAALRRLCAQHDSIDALLEDATQVVLDVLDASHCSVVWVDEDAAKLRVRARRPQLASAACGAQDARVIAFVAHAEATLAAGKPRARAERERARAEQERARALRIGGRVVGFLYAHAGPTRGRRTPGIDATLFDALAEHLGIAIETQHLRQLLASRYATIALSRDREGEGAGAGALDVNVLSAVTHPEKVARIIARSFYKDLRKAGFETKQILVVASELIDSLNVALRRTKAKTTQVDAAGLPDPAQAAATRAR